MAAVSGAAPGHYFFRGPPVVRAAAQARPRLERFYKSSQPNEEKLALNLKPCFMSLHPLHRGGHPAGTALYNKGRQKQNGYGRRYGGARPSDDYDAAGVNTRLVGAEVQARPRLEKRLVSKVQPDEERLPFNLKHCFSELAPLQLGRARGEPASCPVVAHRRCCHHGV